MKLIKLNEITSKIGFDIGDGITIFINNDYFLPINITEKFIIENNHIKLYEGVNILSQNNLFLKKINVIPNELCFINLVILGHNKILINVYSKNNFIYSKVISIYYYNKKVEEIIDLNNIKLKYIFNNLILKVEEKLNSNEIKFNNTIKKNILQKLNYYRNELDKMENQKIMEKINIIKNKFLI